MHRLFGQRIPSNPIFVVFERMIQIKWMNKTNSHCLITYPARMGQTRFFVHLVEESCDDPPFRAVIWGRDKSWAGNLVFGVNIVCDVVCPGWCCTPPSYSRVVEGVQVR